MWTSLAIALGFVLVAFLVAALPAAWMRRRHGGEHHSETRDLAREINGRRLRPLARAQVAQYMIHELSRPFAGLVRVEPDAFEQARSAIRSGL